MSQGLKYTLNSISSNVGLIPVRVGPEVIEFTAEVRGHKGGKPLLHALQQSTWWWEMRQSPQVTLRGARIPLYHKFTND